MRFGGISQPWLKDLAEAVDPVADQHRNQHVRLLPGHPRRHPVLRVRHHAGVQGPHQADRDLLERYLASLHRELASNARELRGTVGELSTFLLAIRRHGWEPALPATAIIFPEDYPKPARPLPRALAAHVMAQAEDPANLNRWASPAYRLITVILIRCGLRISSAVTLPSGCVAAEHDGAPYLRYHNTKMKREALVPIDEELRAHDRRAAGPQPGTLARPAPRCCSPARTPTSTAPAR